MHSEDIKSQMDHHAQSLAHLNAISPGATASAADLRSHLARIFETSFGRSIFDRCVLDPGFPAPDQLIGYKDAQGAPDLLIRAVPAGTSFFCEETARHAAALGYKVIVESDGARWSVHAPEHGATLTVDSLSLGKFSDLALAMIGGGGLHALQTAPAQQAVPAPRKDASSDIAETGSFPARADIHHTRPSVVGRVFRPRKRDKNNFDFRIRVDARDRYVLLAGAQVTEIPVAEDKENAQAMRAAWERIVLEGAVERDIAGDGTACYVTRQDVVFSQISWLLGAIYGASVGAKRVLIDDESTEDNIIPYDGLYDLHGPRKAQGNGEALAGGENSDAAPAGMQADILPGLAVPEVVDPKPEASFEALEFVPGPRSQLPYSFSLKQEGPSRYILGAGSQFPREMLSTMESGATRSASLIENWRMVCKEGAAEPGFTRGGLPCLVTTRDVVAKSLGALTGPIYGYTPNARQTFRVLPHNISYGRYLDDRS